MAAAVLIEKSETSELTNMAGKECTVGRFISEDEGWKIVKFASSWEGTPYSLVGAGSVKGVGGDCSGTTNKIYTEAGFPYRYQSTSKFVEYASSTNRFRKIDLAKDKLQSGDILLWPGHMAIYAPFPEGHEKHDTGVVQRGKKKYNNMYTAFNSRANAPPFGPHNIETFRGDAYTVYRYFYLPNDSGCKK